MSEENCESFSRRFGIAEAEYDIRRMELEMDYHRKQCRLYEEAIREKQRELERMQPRNQHSGIMEDENDGR